MSVGSLQVQDFFTSQSSTKRSAVASRRLAHDILLKCAPTSGAWRILSLSAFTRRVLIITLEPISRKMAGPAIRAVEIGKQLASDHEVTVFSPCASDYKSAKEIFDHANFRLHCQGSKSDLYRLAQNQDIIFIQGNVLKPYPALVDLGKYLVVDLYDPFLLSVLAQFEVDSVSASSSYRLMHQVLKKHMINADFSVCASERQLDYWLGRYCAIGRLTPEMYGFDRSFRKLIDVVPFGLPDRAPERTGFGMRNKVDGIGSDDFVLLWGGGIWEWFDPLTIIEAVAQVSQRHASVKLYFMGYQSPNPQVGLMQMSVKAKELAERLNVLNKNVFFSDSWTAYEDRVNCLLDADVAVSAHFDLPETRFSFRTRILDYFWAGLPILTTCGDELAERVEREGAGYALPYQDVAAWASAIEKLMLSKNSAGASEAGGAGSEIEEMASASMKIGEAYRWSEVVGPIRQFCADPYHAPTFKKIKMPNIVERASAVLERGGKELLIKRSTEIIKDVLRG